MSQKSDLAQFVREALITGRDREEISDVMTQAGWSRVEVAEALDAYSDVPFNPPIPKPQNVVSARDFFIYTLTFAALGAASIYLVLLLHHLIDIIWGDATHSIYQRRSMRTAIAGVIISGPAYAWLTWRERKRLAADPGLYRSAIRKWTTYVALLIAALVFATDVIVALSGFLNGDLTLVFALTLLSIAVVSGAVFWFYLPDTEGKS